MNKEHIDSISEALGEIFETTQAKIMQHLYKELSNSKGDTKEEWKNHQLSRVNAFKKIVNQTINSLKDEMIISIKNASKLTLENATKGDNLKVSEKLLNKQQKALESSLLKQLALSLTSLTKASVKLYKTNINRVYQSLEDFEKSKKSLTKQIDKVINGVGVENDPRVVYTDKRGHPVRNVKWSSWMEMNVRTTMSQKATEFQLEVSRENGIVFYLCNVFGNCADDHKDYQGKIYYDKSQLSKIKDKDILEKIKKYISQHKLLDVRLVMDDKPFLTTRPNCRHKFKPMTIDEVLNNSVSSLLKENKMIDGKYSAKNYKALQRQRLNERTIRKYKERLDNLKTTLSESKEDSQKEIIKSRIEKTESLIRVWQRKNNNLVKSNPTLERDYRRENYKMLVKDLGVRYNS